MCIRDRCTTDDDTERSTRDVEDNSALLQPPDDSQQQWQTPETSGQPIPNVRHKTFKSPLKKTEENKL